MSTLRDLAVSIDFGDIDIRKLLQIDTAMNEIENQFKSMDAFIGGLGRDFKRFGTTGGNALTEIQNEAEDAGNALRTIDTDAAHAETAIEQLGNAGQHAASDISHAMDNAGDAIHGIQSDVNQAENALQQLGDAGDHAANEITQEMAGAGNAIHEIQSDASQAGTALDQLGHAGQQAGNEIDAAMGGAGQATHAAGNQANTAENSFDSLGSAGAKAAAAITTGFAIATASITAIITESETAFSRLEAKTGKTGTELAGLKSASTDVYNAGFGEGLTDVTDSISTMRAMFQGLNDQELTELTKGAYTIGGLWDAEVKQVGKTVKTMTANFEGLSNTEALDLMTVAFQKTGDYSDDLLDTFNEYSVYFSKLGLNAQDFTNVLVKASDAGAFNMDKAGDAIKELGIRVIDESKLTGEGFAAIGLNADHMGQKFAEGGDAAKQAFAATVAALSAMDDPVKQNAAGVALFGTQFEDLRETVILSMTDGKDALGDFEGAADAARAAMQDNFGTKMTKTFRTLKTNIASAFEENGGSDLLDGIASSAEKLVPKIESLVEKAVDFAKSVQDNWPLIKDTAIGIGTAVGSFYAIMGGYRVISTVNTLLTAYRTGTLLTTAAQMGLNTAMLANPLTWIVAGFAALIAVGVLVYRNWDTIKAKASELWGKMVDLKDNAVGALSDKFNEAKDVLVDVKDKFIDFKDNAIQLTKDKLDAFKQTLEDNKTTIGIVAGVITAVFAPSLAIAAGQAVATGATIVASFIGSLVKSAAQAVVTGATVTISFIGSLLATSAQAIATGAVLTASLIGSLVKTAAQAVVTGATLAISFIGTLIRMSAQAVMTGAVITGQLVMSLVRFAAQGWATMASIAATTGAMIVQKGAMVASAAVTATVTAAQWALNAAMTANPIGLVIVAIGALIAIGVLLYKNWDTVKGAAQALWDKIKSAFGGIKDAISGAIEPVIGWFGTLQDKWESFKSSISGFKLPNWVSSIGSTIGGAASKLSSLVSGSHATGLERVPYDGYIAELHKGEAVLTATQSDVLRQTGILGNDGAKPTLDISPLMPQSAPEITNKIHVPTQQPTNEMNPAYAQQPQIVGDKHENTTTHVTTFSPQITIQVEPGANGQVDPSTIADAVKREMEKLFMKLNMQYG